MCTHKHHAKTANSWCNLRTRKECTSEDVPIHYHITHCSHYHVQEDCIQFSEITIICIYSHNLQVFHELQCSIINLWNYIYIYSKLL